MRTRALQAVVVVVFAAALVAAGAPTRVEPAAACNLGAGQTITSLADPGTATSTLSYMTPTGSGADCGTVSCTPPSGSVVPLGATMILCSASGDPGAHPPILWITIDKEPPKIGPLGNRSAFTDAGKALATVPLPFPGVSDNAPGVTLGCDRPFGDSPFAIGSTGLSCVAVDGAGNTTTKIVAVTVADNEPPTIVVPGRTDASTTSASGRTVGYGAVPAVDNSGPVNAASCTPPSGSEFPVGTTTVSCTATDPSGNPKTATFPVVVTRLPDAALPPLIPAVPAVQLVDANPSRFSAKKSSKLRYVLNTPGRVAIVVRRCTGKSSKPCSTLTTARRLNVIGATGLNSATLAGTGLKIGPHRASVTATDGFGRVSKSLTAGFTVTK
jgi:hypothetical protein